MLLDSNIVIYSTEPGYESIKKLVAQEESVVSIISKVEVLGYHNFSPENKKKLENLFQILSILPVSELIIEQAINLRQQRKMSLGDALIAATALTHDLKLVTANVKDFNWIENLELINPLDS